jgi:hypothetical protein
MVPTRVLRLGLSKLPWKWQMQPKIGYLIDENAGWDNDPTWQFYTEKDVPRWRLEHARKDSYKRIVYWEIEETD